MKPTTTSSPKRPTNRRALILAGSIASLFATEKIGATSGIWTGGSDALWSNDANWTASPVPGLGDTATFDNAGNGILVLDLGLGVSVGNLTFDTAAAAAYTLGTGAVNSQSLTLGNAGTISLTSTVAANQLVNAALTLGNDGTAQTFTLSNASTTNSLTIGGGITGSTGSGVKTLAVTGAGATTVSGIIANGSGGTVAISKTGNGTLTLSNTGNTFSGGVTVAAAAGVVTATTFNGTNVSGLGSGAVSIGAGSTVNLLSSNTVATTTNINNTFTGTGLLKLTFTGVTATNTGMSGLAGFAGTIQLSNTGVNGDKLNTNSTMANLAAGLIIDSGSSLFVPAGGTANFAGGISLNGTGNSEGRGAIRMGTAVLGGNISLAGSSTIGLDANAYGVFTGNISAVGVSTLTFGGSQAGNGTLTGNLSDGPGTLSLTKANAGTLWLTGANNYTGATTITGGRLQLGVGGTTGSLSPNSSVIVSSGASITFNRSNAMALGTDFGAISGAGNAIQNGTGTTTFGGATALTYTGITAINRGTLALDFAALATPTNMINSGSTLQLGGGTLSVLGKSAGATAQTFNGTTLTAGRSVIAPNRGTGTSTTVTLGALTNAAGSVVHFTPNTAWAAGANSTTPGVASTTEIVTVASVTRNGTAITMPGAGSFTFIGANMFNGTGSGARYVVALGAGAAPYQLVAMPSSTALAAGTGLAPTIVHQLAGAITLTAPASSYALIPNGGATLTLGANSYTANGILGASTVALTISGAGGVIVGPEKDLVVNLANTGNVTISSVISNNAGGASSVTVSSTGSGIFTPSGANTYTGSTFFNSGTTSIATDGAASAASQLGVVPAAATPGNLTFNGGTLRLVPTAAVTLNANRGITLGAGGGTITNTAAFAGSVAGIIAGIGGLTLSNTSTSTFAITGANTYTGGTFINSGGTGAIVVSNNSAFGVGGILTLNGGVVRAFTTSNVSLANPVNIAADTTFVTTATEKSLTFTGPATLSGTRTLNSGVGSTVAGLAVQFSNGISESTAGSGLIKAGTGNLTLSGLNTFTGPTNINAGRVSYTKAFSLYANTPASWTDTNITVASGATMMLSVGGVNEFTSANVATIAGLGTATGGFQTGATLGLDTTNGSLSLGALANPNGGANAINLLKIGANNLTLNGTNTYTGITTIQGGTVFANGSSTTSQIIFNGGTNTTLQVTNPGATGTGSINIATGATTPSLLFRLDGGGNISLPNSLIGNSGITTNIDVNNNGTGTNGVVQLNGIPTTGIGNVTFNITGGNGYSLYIASIFASGGANGTTLVNPTTASVTFGNISSITNNFAYNWQFDGTATGNAVTGAITNGSGPLSVTKANTSTWTLSGNNTYSGATAVNAGTLILSGTNTGAGATTVVGGTLQAGADGALNPNSAVTMTDAAAAGLDLNGKLGTIASLAGGGPLGGNVTLGSGTLTTGDATSTSYSGNITGAGNLVKAGTGAFTLATPQAYTGTTAVNAGSLLVNSTLASSAVTVAGGTLGGTGTLAGTVTIGAGGILSPATSTTAGTITVAGLTLNAGSGIAYEFGGTSDLVAVTNANGLTLNGGALSLFATGGVTPLVTNGTYTLFNYLTAFGGALTNLSVANSQAGKTYSVADTGSTITLTVGTAVSTDWNGGAADGLWTTAGNWTGGTPNSVGAVATLGTTPTSPTSIAVDGAKTTGSIIFDNANAYTITGGATDTITLDSGIAAAVLSVTTGSHTITAPIVLNGPVNITPSAGTSLTLGGIISGSKTVTYSGAGTATVSGANTYSAGTTLVSGTLSLANGAALGTGTFTIAGGTLDAASALTLTNNNAQVWSGDFAFTGSNNLNLGTGAVSIPVSRTVTVNGSTLTVGGAISGSGLIKAGNGALELTANNTFSGALTVSAGTVILSGENSARPAATNGQTVVNGTLQLQANAGNTTAGVSTALSGERTAGQPLSLNTGGTLQLRSDSAVTFAGANSMGGLGSATVAIDVNQLTGAGTNNAITLAPGGFNVSATTINVSGGNGYSLRLPTITSVGANTSTYNGNSAPISIGTYTASVTGAHVLGLGGTNTANVVTGVISNGSATSVAVLKTGSSSWDLQGVSTFTGALTVREGTLTISGGKTGNIGAITVGDTAGLSATLNISTGTYPLAANNFNVGNQATTPGTATVNQSGGAVSFTGGNQLLIGQNTVGNTGTYNLSGGSITTITSATRGIMLGVNANATGIFNLSGTGVLNMTAASGGGGNAFLQIGRSDTTTADNTTTLFNQTGGTANVGILGIGGGGTGGVNGINLSSTLTLTGGTFIASTFTVLAAGNTNTATINIGGTADVTLPAFPTVRGTSSTATINFDGGTLRSLAASTTYMGSLTNAFIKAGGAKFDLANNITVTQALLAHPISTGGGFTKAGAGTLTLTGANTYTGSTTVNGGTLILSGLSTHPGKTVVSAGTISFNTIGNVGGGSSALGAPTTVAEGTIDLAGGLTYTGAATSTDRVINLTNSAAAATINNSGSGLLTLNGDVTGNSSNLLYRGNGNITMNGVIPATHTGTVTHTDAGTLTLTNAANAFTGALVVSKAIVSVDTIDNKGVASGIGAGTLITLGQSGFNNTGTFQFTGVGGGSTDRDIDIQSNAANANGGIIENTVAGQLLTLSGNITVGGTGTLPTLGLTGVGNGRLSGDILGTSPLAITKSGTGTWTLGGADTQTGVTTVNAGTLNITGSISGSAVVVNSTGTLGGSGFTGALTVNSGGTVAPGQSPGVLSTGAATFAAGSTLAIEVNGLTLGTQYDQLSVTGAVNITGATLSLSGSYLTTPAITNDLFTILLNDGSSDAITGTFAGLAEGAHAFSGFGQDYTISYVGGDGNDIVLTAVPEPGSAVLVLGGLALLGARRRRRME